MGAANDVIHCNADALAQRLAGHPLLQRLGGNPGRLQATSQLVTPDLGSLFDLCAGTSSGSAAVSGPTPNGRAMGSPLPREMSVDESDETQPPAPALSMVRDMSVDD